MNLEVAGSSPEWVPIFYETRSTAQGFPESSFLRGNTSVPEQLNIKAITVTGACKLIDGCSLELCFATPPVVSHLAYATEIKSIQLHDSIVMALP